MILSESEQEYIAKTDRRLQTIIEEAAAIKGTPQAVAAIILGLIAKQQAQTNALLVHMIHFMERGPEDRPGPGHQSATDALNAAMRSSHDDGEK